MNQYVAIGAAIVAIFSRSTVAAGLEDAEVAFRAGNWKVLRTTDPMKDKVVCTGTYKDNYRIQLTEDSLFVPVKGGIQGITLRFGDKPARSIRPASEMEKRVANVIITGADFSELVESNRLRVQAVTLVRGLEDTDLDLVGIKDAIESIKAGCPIQTISRPKVERTPSSICTEALISRMKAQGLTEAKIVAICKD